MLLVLTKNSLLLVVIYWPHNWHFAWIATACPFQGVRMSVEAFALLEMCVDVAARPQGNNLRTLLARRSSSGKALHAGLGFSDLLRLYSISLSTTSGATGRQSWSISASKASSIPIFSAILSTRRSMRVISYSASKSI